MWSKPFSFREEQSALHNTQTQQRSHLLLTTQQNTTSIHQSQQKPLTVEKVTTEESNKQTHQNQTFRVKQYLMYIIDLHTVWCEFIGWFRDWPLWWCRETLHCPAGWMRRLCVRLVQPGAAACIRMRWWRPLKPRVSEAAGLYQAFPDDWRCAAASDRPEHTNTGSLLPEASVYWSVHIGTDVWEP